MALEGDDLVRLLRSVQRDPHRRVVVASDVPGVQVVVVLARLVQPCSVLVCGLDVRCPEAGHTRLYEVAIKLLRPLLRGILRAFALVPFLVVARAGPPIDNVARPTFTFKARPHTKE